MELAPVLLQTLDVKKETFDPNKVEIVFGAPGCGKTTYLMQVLEKELELNAPDKIAFVSYTRKGTYEGRDRVMSLFDFREDDLPFFRTLHSIAFRECGYSKSGMVSKKDYRVFSRGMGMSFTGYYTEDFSHNDDVYLFLESLFRNNPSAIKAFHDINVKTLIDVQTNYIRFKKEENIADFTDIIEEFIRRGNALPVDVAIIDEAQDLTALQWEMVRVAFKDCKRIYIAGDDDQAIYEWSGADVKRFLNLKGRKTILDKSYRLPKSVLALSKQVTAQMSQRIDKVFEPHNAEGEIHYYVNFSEFKPPTDGSSVYLLARNNWYLRWYRSVLRETGTVFWDKDKVSVDKRLVAAINAFERARRNQKTTDADKLAFNYYLRKPYNMQWPWYDNFNLEVEVINYYRDLIRTKAQLDVEPTITVNTFHGVKGGEADDVVVLMDHTNAVANHMYSNPDAELRCLYVALTRAKKRLHIVFRNSKQGYDPVIWAARRAAKEFGD